MQTVFHNTLIGVLYELFIYGASNSNSSVVHSSFSNDLEMLIEAEDGKGKADWPTISVLLQRIQSTMIDAINSYCSKEVTHDEWKELNQYKQLVITSNSHLEISNLIERLFELTKRFR